METAAGRDILPPVYNTAIEHSQHTGSPGPRRPVNQRRLRFLLLALGLCGLLSSGCRSAHPTASGGSAVMVIEGKVPDEIGDVIAEGFRHQGYTLVRRDKAGLTFEKEGSAMSNFAYGSWLGGTTVWVRVKVSIVLAGDAGSRLECRGFRVTNKGDAIEEEVELRSGPWQKIVADAAHRLGAHPSNFATPPE